MIGKSSEIFKKLDQEEKLLCKELGLKNFKESEIRLINQVEQLTKNDIWYLLWRHEVPYHSEDYRDYSRAKLLVVRTLYINETIYNQIIDWISEYLNL